MFISYIHLTNKSFDFIVHIVHNVILFSVLHCTVKI